MKEFDLTSKGLLSQADKAKDPEWVPSRAEQAQTALAVINTLVTASSAQIAAYDNGDDLDIDLHSIRSTMLGVCKGLDKDFARLLELVVDLSSNADIYTALVRQAGRLKKKEIRKAEKKTYFIKNKETGLLKIGRSYDPEARAKSLQCGAGSELDIILVLDEDVERELHLRFSDDRAFNEWFYHSEAIESYIKTKRFES